MDKLIEREPAARPALVAAPALAIQFFVIPLVVVGVTVLGYLGFRSLVGDTRTAQDYVSEVRFGGTNRRWPAAYELSRLLYRIEVRADRTAALAPEGLRRLEQRGRSASAAVSGPCPGRLDPPLPPQAVAVLAKALDDPDGEARISAIWALGASGDAAVIPKLLPLYQSTDAGIRKMVVYALGALPGESQDETLRTALQDSTADVRWHAAVALARHGTLDGMAVLRQMLDRESVERMVKRDVRVDEDQDPIADVMISGLRAIATLKAPSLRPTVESLSQQDRSMKVRQAALEALKVMG